MKDSVILEVKNKNANAETFVRIFLFPYQLCTMRKLRMWPNISQ